MTATRALGWTLLLVAVGGCAAGFVWPFVHDWGPKGDNWGWLAAWYCVGWFAAAAALGLVVSGLMRRALVWPVLGLFALDIVVIFVWFRVAGNHGAFSSPPPSDQLATGVIPEHWRRRPSSRSCPF